MIVVGGERDAIQRRAHALIARVTRQLHAEAAIDLGHEAAAVARVVGVTPAVALAEELEALADQVRAGQRQIVRRHVCGSRQQRRREMQRAIGCAHRQLDDVRGVGMLTVHRLLGRPVAQHRKALTHFQLQLGNLRPFRREHCVRRRAGDDEVRLLVRVGEHFSRAPCATSLSRNPRRVARTDDEPPFAVATLVHDRDGRAGEQRVLLEPIDVGAVIRYRLNTRRRVGNVRRSERRTTMP